MTHTQTCAGKAATGPQRDETPVPSVRSLSEGSDASEANVGRQTVVLTIDRHPPVSLNAVLRMYRFERAKHNRLWKDEAVVAWVNAGRPEFERANVTITLFYRGDRVVQDDDNLYGSVKPIVDGLKGLAFPRDDANCIRLYVTRRVDNASPRVEIALSLDTREDES